MMCFRLVALQLLIVLLLSFDTTCNASPVSWGWSNSNAEEETNLPEVSTESDDLLTNSDHEITTTNAQVSDSQDEMSSSDEVTTQDQSENESPNTIEEETSRDSSSDEERAADQSIVQSTTEEQEETTTETTEHETEKTDAEDEQSNTSGEESREEESESTTENQEESTSVDQNRQDEENEVEASSASSSDENETSDTPAPTQCGGQITSAKGEIHSPNFPDEYEPNLNCVWLLTVTDGSRVQLKFDSLETEEGGECDYDYLEVREGHSEDGNLIGKFCGDEVPKDVESTSNKLFVKFISDSGNQRSGFSASFTEIPSPSVSLDNEIVLPSEARESEAVTTSDESVMSEAASSGSSSLSEDTTTTVASEAESEKTEVDSDESFMAGREEKDGDEEVKSQSTAPTYEESTSVKSATADEENEVISESVSDEDDVPIIRRKEEEEKEKQDESDTSSASVIQTTMIETSTQSISDLEHAIHSEMNNQHESVELTTSDSSTVTPCEVYECGSGFRSVCGETDECVDIDECSQEDKCAPGRVCYNTPGTFICILREDISDEECSHDSDCSVGSQCLNISRSFKCVQMEKRQECSHIHECQEGYICHDNECIKSFCGENGTLELNVRGEKSCQCKSGFKLNSFRLCVDIDECSEHEDLCMEGKCINTVPGYTCECEVGYKSFDGSCTDIDECSDGSHTCQLDEDCFNEPGTYHCESAQSSLMLFNGQQQSASSASSTVCFSSLNLLSLTVICVILNFTTLHLIKL